MMKRSIGVLVLLLGVGAFLAAQAPGLSFGVGHTSSFRVGPGKDSAGAQVYSFNYVYAAVLFDAAGRIVDLEVDALEVSTPNYDGATMPHFSGWPVPGAPAINLTNHETGKVDGDSPATVEAANAEIAAWKTKRDRGDHYGMTENTTTSPKSDWYRQMDNFEKLFIGKTVDELDAWFARFTSDVNGRLLNPSKPAEKDVAKVGKLTAKEKQMLIDARTGATMSVSDSHGNIAGVVRDAWNKRKPVAPAK